MRDNRSLAFLGLGLALALITAVALFSIANGAADRNAQSVDIVVASVDIPAQTVLAADMLTLKAYPVDVVPSGTLTNAAALVGQRVVTAIPNGLPIVRGHLAGSASRNVAAPNVERGKVLVAFPTTDPLSSAGLVGVGDRVDILATIASGPAGERVTQTTIQDLEVVQVLGSAQQGRGVSLVFIVDHQQALVLKHLRDAPAAVDIVVRSREQRESIRTERVDLPFLIQNYGLRR